MLATVLEALNSTSAEIGEATAMVLEDPAYRSKAQLVQGGSSPCPMPNTLVRSWKNWPNGDAGIE